jgi:hypothetical protein
MLGSSSVAAQLVASQEWLSSISEYVYTKIILKLWVNRHLRDEWAY